MIGFLKKSKPDKNLNINLKGDGSLSSRSSNLSQGPNSARAGGSQPQLPLNLDGGFV
jgi:hypothetical protein